MNISDNTVKLGVNMNKELDNILSNNFSEEFITHMKNAMVMSYYKCKDKRGNGDINTYVGSICIDMINKELAMFNEDHNTEHMVNIANYSMIRYMFPQNDETYNATDSNKSSMNIKEDTVTNFIREHLINFN